MLSTSDLIHSSLGRSFLATVFLLVGGWTVGIATASAQSTSDDGIGKVSKVDGLIFVRRGSSFKVAKPGLVIKSGAEISTAVFAKLELELRDGTRVTISERSVFVIEKFTYDAAEPAAAAADFKLDSGALRVAMGDLGKAGEAGLRIRTPLAEVLAGRGTFWAGHKFFPGDGLHVAQLGGGQVTVRTRGGDVVVQETGYGTIVDNANLAPMAAHEWTPEKIESANDAVRIR